MDEQRLRCPQCGVTWTRHREGNRCTACGEVYPTVCGAIVSIPRAAAFLDETTAQLQAERVVHAAPVHRPLDRVTECISVRAQRAAELNNNVLDSLLAGIQSTTAVVAEAEDLADFFTRQNVGWPLRELFWYFFVDWSGAKAAEEARAAIVASVNTYCSDTSGALVLGCGASGLVRDLARITSWVDGVDLSLPALLLGRRLLDGGQFAFALRDRDVPSAPVSVQGVDQALPNVGLLAADVTRLPFENESKSLVVTQYLLDIVPWKELLVREVNRVLKPGGIWINYSLPFRLRGDSDAGDYRGENDLAHFLTEAEFDIILSERRLHVFRDLSSLDPWLRGYPQGVIHFVARRRALCARDPFIDASEAYFAEGSRVMWSFIPHFVLGTSVEVVRGWTYTALGKSSRIKIAMTGVLFDSCRDPSSHRLAEFFFDAVDNHRDLAGIREHLEHTTGSSISERSIAATARLLYGFGILEFVHAETGLIAGIPNR